MGPMAGRLPAFLMLGVVIIATSTLALPPASDGVENGSFTDGMTSWGNAYNDGELKYYEDPATELVGSLDTQGQALRIVDTEETLLGYVIQHVPPVTTARSLSFMVLVEETAGAQGQTISLFGDGNAGVYFQVEPDHVTVYPLGITASYLPGFPHTISYTHDPETGVHGVWVDHVLIGAVVLEDTLQNPWRLRVGSHSGALEHPTTWDAIQYGAATPEQLDELGHVG